MYRPDAKDLLASIWSGLVGAEGPAQVRWGNISDHEPMQIMMFKLQYLAYMKGLIEGPMRLGSLD